MKRETSAFENFVRVGTAAARAAGDLLMVRLRTEIAVTNKGAVNLVTDVDVAAEELIVTRLLDAFPDHAVLAEEKHSRSEGRSHTWVIDPLDGTTNYAHGFPVFVVSIGLEIEGSIEWGIVYNPNLEEVFTARRGQGAQLNGAPLEVSSTESLGSSLLATGFPYDIRTSKENNLDYFAQFAVQAQGIRRAGAAALDLAYVAAGRFDGFWELKLCPWDCAAGYLLVTEAGGRVTKFSGEPGSIYDKECVASNERIHEQMLAVIRETRDNREDREVGFLTIPKSSS